MYRVCLLLFYLLVYRNNGDTLPTQKILGFESTVVISYICVYSSPNVIHTMYLFDMVLAINGCCLSE